MLALFILASSHVTLNPNFGAFSGGYFHTTLRVPHGEAGMHTTRLAIDVPHGVLVVKPEVPDNWAATIETRELSANERYTSHGVTKTTAPHRITFVAESHSDGVHDDHLLNIDMQLKIGCIFQDRASNTQWSDEYTLWWPVTQVCELADGTQQILSWNSTHSQREDGTSASWSALPMGMHPSPYMYVEPGTRCSIDHSGTESQGGLQWFGSHIPSDIRDSPVAVTHTILDYMTLVVSIVALTMATVALLLWCIVVCLRLKNKKNFTNLLGIGVGSDVL